MMSPESAAAGQLAGAPVPAQPGAVNAAYGKAEVPKAPAAGGPYQGGWTAGGPSIDQEKKALLLKLWEVQRGGVEAKAKWWSFCKVHADGNTEPKTHDVAFLQTFFECLEGDDIEIEEGCPFQPKGKGKSCGKDSKGKGCCGKDGGKGFGGKDAGKGFGGKDGGKGWGKDGGKGGKGGGGGNVKGASEDQKIFVGGIPKDATEEELSAHFGFYGTVLGVSMKYDDWGGFKGFGFVTFESTETVQKVLADVNNQMFKGKWIDCKTTTNSSGGGSGGAPKGDKGGKGKGDKGKGDKGGKGKGGKDKGKKGGGWGGGGGGGSSWGGGGGWNSGSW